VLRPFPFAGAPVRRMAAEGRPTSAGSRDGLLTMLPSEVVALIVPRLLDRAQPVGRLASCSRALACELADPAGRLRAGSIVTCRLRSALEGVQRASLAELEVVRVDLTAEDRDQLHSQQIERVIRQLSDCLARAVVLKVLAVRLASFDVSMERLRLGRGTWQALIRGLAALAGHQRLRSLELSFISIKASAATQDVNIPPEECRLLRRASSSPTRGAGAAAARSGREKLTFLEALSRFSKLEELVLTHDEIYGTTAEMLAPIFRTMGCLKRVDLARNHISDQVMKAVRKATPKEVELCGSQQQTCFFH